MEIISLLVDNGTSTVVRNSGSTGPNAEKLAEQTKDPKVIQALKPKAKRSASRAEVINKTVDIVKHFLYRANSSIKRLYHISGKDSPDIRNIILQNIFTFLV